MANITIHIQGLEKLQVKLRPGALSDPVIRDTLTKAALLTEREARESAPKDTGALARSIVSEVHSPLARVYTPLASAPVMEEGRQAGARMPPPDALAGWARRHGMPGMEFVLARSIARRGIKGRFFMQKAAAKLKNVHLPRLLAEAGARLQGTWNR